MTTSLSHLRRIRWAVRGSLALAVAASVVANTLHAQPNPVGRAIAAWPPLALLLTIELISRVPVHRRRLAVVRFAATAGIAGIAAWVSYWHMVSVCGRYGESPMSARLIPLSVDGVVVVASVCLVEIAGRLRDVTVPVVSAVPASSPDTVPLVEPDTTLDIDLTGEPDIESDTDRIAHRSRRAGRSDTGRAVARLRRRHPDMSTTDIARRLGVTDRTVRRHLRPADADVTPVDPSQIVPEPPDVSAPTIAA